MEDSSVFFITATVITPTTWTNTCYLIFLLYVPDYLFYTGLLFGETSSNLQYRDFFYLQEYAASSFYESPDGFKRVFRTGNRFTCCHGLSHTHAYIYPKLKEEYVAPRKDVHQFSSSVGSDHLFISYSLSMMGIR